MDEWQLLRQYVEEDSQEAFSSLVERYIDLVYSTCLREVRDPVLAEDVTQVVFLILARKAGQVRQGTLLSLWLYRTARFAAHNARKQEARRHRYEQQAAGEMMREMMHEMAPDKEAGWQELEPLLHEALDSLNARERNVVMLRFFEGRSLRDTGNALGITEEGARRRISRVIEKLRRYFSKRGFLVSTTLLAALLAENSVQAAPAHCAAATLKMASVAALHAATADAVGWRVFSLCQSTMRTMLVHRTSAAVGTLLGIGLVGIGLVQVIELSLAGAPREEVVAPLPPRLQVTQILPQAGLSPPPARSDVRIAAGARAAHVPVVAEAGTREMNTREMNTREMNSSQTNISEMERKRRRLNLVANIDKAQRSTMFKNHDGQPGRTPQIPEPQLVRQRRKQARLVSALVAATLVTTEVPSVRAENPGALSLERTPSVDKVHAIAAVPAPVLAQAPANPTRADAPATAPAVQNRTVQNPAVQHQEARKLVVTTTADVGPGSLRQALLDAVEAPGSSISFNIPDTDANFKDGVFTILPQTPLPVIRSAGTIIDGSTQTAFTGDTNKLGPEVVLMSDNPRSMRGNGLYIIAANCVVKALTINGSKGNAFRSGVMMSGPGATGNRVIGCIIGLDRLGQERMGNLVGVQAYGGANGNVIGGATAEEHNVIAGNDSQIKFVGQGTQLNKVQGNFIGTSVDGETAIDKDAITIMEGAANNLIGGDGPGEGNLICSLGAGGGAVRVEGAGSDGNVIQGNLMGCNKTGTRVISRCSTGVRILDQAKDNLVGGTTAGAGNLIVGATEAGIHLYMTSNNIVQRNYIGCDISGVKPLGNHTGITIEFSSGNLIGGTEIGCGNIIAGNTHDGILFIGDEVRGESSRNIIQGNYIGLAFDGRTALGNGGVGIRITGIGSNNMVGLAEDGSGTPNIIAFNQGLATLEQGPDPAKLVGNRFRGNSSHHNGDKT